MFDNDKLRKLQLIEVEILDEFVRICEKHDLTYYLYYGTLLGAVRHKGFIPWDDDLDVVMPRRDYEKFCNVVQKEIQPDFFAENFRSDPGYPGCYLCIKRKGTKYIPEYMTRLQLKEYGVWMDVHALDNVSNTKSFKFFLQSVVVPKIIRRLAYHRAVKNISINSYLTMVADCISRIMPLRLWTWLQDTILQLDSDDNSEKCIVFINAYSWKKNLMLRTAFGKPVKLQFEGKQYNVPQDWDYILRRLYGDYMKIPPKEMRITHEPVVWEV